jgi:hypothetical protein
LQDLPVVQLPAPAWTCFLQRIRPHRQKKPMSALEGEAICIIYDIMEDRNSQDIQSALFAKVAAGLPSHLSLADELAGLLNVSRDSAYRRLRGDTLVSLQEAAEICRHFGVSLQGLTGSMDGAVTFQKQGDGDARMEERLQRVNEFLGHLEQAREKEITYFSMELSFFHVLQVPDLLRFKLHYWDSIAHPDQSPGKIDLDGTPLSGLHNEIVNRYIRIPSTEIIYGAALSTTMMQFLYFLESGNFAAPEDALRLFDALQALVEHLKAQAALGRKFRFGAAAPAQGRADTFRLFHNELIYSQNIIHTRADAQEHVFLENNVINFLQTDDPVFCAETRETLAAIQRKSVPISAVSERERNKFFNRLSGAVAQARSRAEGILAEGM